MALARYYPFPNAIRAFAASHPTYTTSQKVENIGQNQ
jgi:hypothetical protein